MENPQGLEKFQVTDREQCGVIIEAEDRTYVVKIPNCSSDPRSFAIVIEDVVKIESVLSKDERIIGFMHTHLPDMECEPSDSDFDGSEIIPDAKHLIYKPDTKETCWYGALKEVDK